MKPIILIGCALLLIACKSPIKPTIAPGQGAILGTIETRSHSELIVKAKNSSNDPESRYNTLNYSEAMVNYDKLDDIYVGLVGAGSQQTSVVDLKVTENGFEPRAVAISTGNRIRIVNATANSLTFYAVSLDSDEVEDFAPLAAGATSDIIISQEGLLEIGADERDDLIASVLSRPGMQVRRATSGATYVFNNQPPGDYRMVFWYWRLGMLERAVSVKVDEATEVNEYLSVDRLFSN